jgi:DHA1 family tetracycline resistance protein-like MFS transporter
MQNKVLFAVVFTVFIDLLGLGILIPVIPQLLANPASPYFLLPHGWTLAQGYILLGFLTAIFPFMQFFATPLLGELSDRFGRRPILIISLFGTCLSYVIFAIGIITRNLPLLFIGRAFDGITGGNIAVAQAAIADITAPENRAKNFGLIGAAFGMGFILGPYLGGALSDSSVVPWFNAAAPFWFAAGLSLLNTLSVIFLLPETLKVKARELYIHWAQSVKNIISAVVMPKTRGIFASTFLYQAGFTFFTTFSSVFLISRFRWGESEIGNYFAYIGIWIAIAQAVVTRKVSARWNGRTIVSYSLFGTGLFVLAQFLPTVWWGLLLVVPFFAIFAGLTQANLTALVSGSVGPEMQGEVLGINASVQALAQTIPPVLSGYIAASIGATAPVFVAGVTILLAGVVFVTMYRGYTPSPDIGVPRQSAA